MENHSFNISGHIVDLVHNNIYTGTLTISHGKITHIQPGPVNESQYLLPGFIDAHVHIESSMVPPAEFARIAMCHGTVATVSDPHEIANVLGIEGIKYMINNGKQVPFKFFFGAPGCVPSTTFETAGFTLNAKHIQELMAMDDIHYLAEMMNCPGVIYKDPDILQKLQAARLAGKPIDGHAPALSGADLHTYIAEGISTDHECFTLAEAEEKIAAGMKILIREGSAAKNFNTLIPLMASHAAQLMFCSDDKHPNDLVKGHINLLVKRAVAMGYPVMDVLRAASLNTIEHYHLNVGLLQTGDDADFIVCDNITDLNILQTYIKGQKMAENGISVLPYLPATPINNFHAMPITAASLKVEDRGKRIKVISCMDGQLITQSMLCTPKTEHGNIVSDTERDILKMVVINRYQQASPAIAFIHNTGLKQGAVASSVAHDSHNIVAVGTSDDDIAAAVNMLVECGGGVVAYSPASHALLPLPIAGLMSPLNGYNVADAYEQADALAHQWGCTLQAPFMTLAFMSLVVIPELKLSDQGLFDVNKFNFTSLYED